MSDLARKRGIVVDKDALARELGVPVVETVGVKLSGVTELLGRLDAAWPVAAAQAASPATADVVRDHAEVRRILAAAGGEARAGETMSDRVDRVVLHPVAGFALLILVKIPLLHMYSWSELSTRTSQFAWTAFGGFTNGVFVSLFFLLKFREARARAKILQGEADRNRLSRQAIEAQLKLMQAQVEPHFLFNTLASVQFLTETDPPKAGQMLGHLLAYLRAALPHLRSGSSTLGQEIELARAYLSIMQMRMGSRLAFSVALPESLRAAPFPPMLLMSVVENAVKHGIEPKAEGGSIRIEAQQDDETVTVSVVDTGQGLSGEIGRGVGLTNLRERLQALYGRRARFSLQAEPRAGARATIELPSEAAVAD
jgi:hypothetical protein